MACAVVHRAAVDESYNLALDVGAGSALAAGLPGHPHRMRCGVVWEVKQHKKKTPRGGLHEDDLLSDD